MRKKTISTILRSNLLIIVVLAFLISTSVIYLMNTKINTDNYKEIIYTTLVDIEKDIEETSDMNMLDMTYYIGGEIEAKLKKMDGSPSAEDMNAFLSRIAEENELSEVSIGSKENVIIYSNKEEYIGFDMNSNPKSKAFGQLNHGRKELVQPVRKNAYTGEGDYDQYNKYAGVSLKSGGYVQIAISSHQFQKQIDEKVRYIATNRHIGQTGYTIISDIKDNIISNADGDINVNLSEIGLELDGRKSSDKLFVNDVNGKESLYMYKFVEGYYIISIVPMEEVQSFRNRASVTNAVTEILVFAVMFIFISILLNKIVVSRLRNVNSSLHKIIEGELDTKVNEYSTKEFSLLSKDINLTVSTLKEYTEREKERIKKELEFAKNIQEGSLPKLSSLNTEGCGFDLYATMNTAKEVGGDFYDFYKLDDSRLAFLIADVSGKGVPAAMFMMTCKTMLKNLVESSADLGEVFTKANAELIESNDAGMFVTVWMGIIDLDTGHVEYVNAGHNPPLAYNENGEFEYMNCKPGFVLTGMPGLKYKTQEFSLKPGDKLYLYTDGVTEANNLKGDMYGEDRLIEFMNRNRNESLKNILLGIKEDLDSFADGAEQFDDITMLGVIYTGDR